MPARFVKLCELSTSGQLHISVPEQADKTIVHTAPCCLHSPYMQTIQPDLLRPTELFEVCGQ